MTEKNHVTVHKYFQFLADQKLMGSECPECSQIDLPPRRICSQCQHETHWKELEKTATVQAFTAIYVGTPVMSQKGYTRTHPYIFTVAKLDAGPMISGLLVDAEKYENNPDLLQIGHNLEITFVKTEIGKDGEGKPQFRWDVGFKPL